MRPICIKCNKCLCEKNGNGKGFRKLCGQCRKPDRASNIYRRKVVFKNCTRCNFIPEDICQLEVHHIDEDHSNNDRHNLQVLCANCHALITYGKAYKAEKEKKWLTTAKH